jgi:hypothetical protein
MKEFGGRSKRTWQSRGNLDCFGMDEPSLQVSSETERQTGQLIPILIRILKYLVQFAIVAVLLWQIYTIGLANILRELPRVPLFLCHLPDALFRPPAHGVLHLPPKLPNPFLAKPTHLPQKTHL